MSLRKAFDVQSPVFKPVWLRVAMVVFCLCWALLEVSRAAYGWAAIFGGAGIYLAYQFFVVFDPDEEDEE